MAKSTLNLSDNCTIEPLTVGQEGEPLLMVDSYLSGVDQIRNYAIHINKFTPSKSFYPGIRMEVPFAYTAALAQNFKTYIEDFFGLSLSDAKKAVSQYSIVTCQPEELKLFQKLPHFDAPSRNSLAIIHYLCDAPDSGTALYRHKQSNYEYIDEIRVDGYMQQLKHQFNEPANHPKGYILGDTNEYEVIKPFTAKYNRLIMYRGSSLHSGIIQPDYTFDPSPKTGRLTIATFIEFS